MKILHFITDLEIGGAETRLVRLIEYGNRSFFQHVVVSLMDEGKYGKKLKNMNVPVETLGITFRKPWRLFPWKSTGLVRKYTPDVIVGWMYHGNLIAMISTMYNPSRIPVVWNISHSLYDLKKEKITTRFVIRLLARYSKYPDRIIYNSYTGLAHHSSIGYSDERSKVIPNGFDCKKFCPSIETRENFRSFLNISEDIILVGMVGRYHPVKRHDIFLLSALQLLEQESSVRFVLVGRDVEWSNPAIAGIVPEEKRNYFFVLGERNDVHTIIPAFDIAVSTSDSESFPNVVGEAMACGVPCIVTDAGDSPMVVGDTGIAIPRDDINALTEALKKLIKLPREERYKLGVSARERILKGYSLSTMVSQYEKLFCEVADVQSAEK